MKIVIWGKATNILEKCAVSSTLNMEVVGPS
jgi:hypothetical protein